MRKKILCSLAALGMAGMAGAQGFYERLSLGYGLPSASQTMDGTATPYNGTMNSSTSGSTSMVTYDLKKASFSAGMQSCLAIGYMFNEHVGVDMGFNFVLGAKKYTLNDNNVVVSGIMSNVQITQQAKVPILATPSLVLMSGSGDLKVYTRIGVVLPLKTRIIQDQIFTNLPGTGAIESDDYKWEIKNKFSVGFSGALGFEKKLGSAMSLYAEGSFLSLALYASEGNLQDVYVNGQGGYLQYVAADQRKITYASSFTASSGDYFHQPTYSQPFSNFSINVGIVFRMGQEHSSHSSSDKKHDDRRDGYFRR